MKNQNTFLNINTLIDYCNGTLNADEQEFVSQTAADNDLIKAIIEQLQDQSPIQKNEFTQQIDQSMASFLNSEPFANSFETASNLPNSSPKETQNFKLIKNSSLKTTILWILGMLSIAFICFLGFQIISNHQNEVSNSGLLSNFVPRSLNQKSLGLQDGIRLSGTVKNSNEEYAVLIYTPRKRGNINYDGFKSIGTWLDPKGNFNLNAAQVTHGGNYTLKIKDHYSHMVFFKGDNIHLEMNLSSPSNSFFATGRGGGKLNVLNLPQLKYTPYNNEWPLDHFKAHMDSVVAAQESLLEAIFAKDLSKALIMEAPNRTLLNRIIKETPLSKEEYEFLKIRIWIYKTSVLNYLSKMRQYPSEDANPIKFDHPIFDDFTAESYQSIKHINDWQTAGALDDILQIEFLKNKYGQTQSISIQDWQSIKSDPSFSNWVSPFLKENFNEAVSNKYLADNFAMLMTLGMCKKEQFDQLKVQCTDDKILNSIIDYHDLIDYGLEDNTYQLDREELELDDSKFKALIDDHKGKPLYIIFWSAKYAGGMIIGNLPEVKAFEEKNKDDIKVINICFDQARHKGLWAARIIDNSWNSTHYFMPLVGKESIWNKYISKNISSFGNGGVTYTFINKEGTIKTKAKSPMDLVSEDIEKYLK